MKHLLILLCLTILIFSSCSLSTKTYLVYYITCNDHERDGFLISDGFEVNTDFFHFAQLGDIIGQPPRPCFADEIEPYFYNKQLAIEYSSGRLKIKDNSNQNEFTLDDSSDEEAPYFAYQGEAVYHNRLMHVLLMKDKETGNVVMTFTRGDAHAHLVLREQ